MREELLTNPFLWLLVVSAPVLKRLPWISTSVLCKVLENLNKCPSCSWALARVSSLSKLLMKWNPLRLTGCDDQGAYGITDGWRGERATAAFSLRWSEILKYCREKKKKLQLFSMMHLMLMKCLGVKPEQRCRHRFIILWLFSHFYVNFLGLLQMVFDIIELPVWFIPIWEPANFSKAKEEAQKTVLCNWSLSP